MSIKLIKNFLSLILIALYILLLIPYSVVSSVEKNGIIENGIVVSTQPVSYNSLPTSIQEILQYESDYNLIVISDVKSPEKSAVLYQGDQYLPGDFIKIEQITTDLYIDYHYLSLVKEPFNRLIIAQVDKVQYGGDLIEFLFANKLMILMIISKVVFYIGGFLIIIIISLIYRRRPEIWNIPGVLSCYSLQFFILNIFSMWNQQNVIATSISPDFVDKFSSIFGYLFILLIPLTIITKKYESTDEGEQLIYKLFQYHMQKLKLLRSMFNK